MQKLVDLFCVLTLYLILVAAIPVLLLSVALEDFERRKS